MIYPPMWMTGWEADSYAYIGRTSLPNRTSHGMGYHVSIREDDESSAHEAVRLGGT